VYASVFVCLAQGALLRRCADIAAGLTYLHSRNVCHGDLKVRGLHLACLCLKIEACSTALEATLQLESQTLYGVITELVIEASGSSCQGFCLSFKATSLQLESQTLCGVVAGLAAVLPDSS
jgi:serine/threonine protein kinase